MDFTELAQARYSVRKFSDKAVEPEVLSRILEAGLLAPTAKNNQPQRIYVLQSKEALHKLDSLTHCRYGAGTVLLFTYDTEEDWKNPLEEGVHSGVEDVSITATYIMLRAVELGVYTTWCNYFANSKLEQTFALPENEKAVLVTPIGYKTAETNPTPAHFASKPLSSIVKYM